MTRRACRRGLRAAPDVPDENALATFRDELLTALEAGDHAQRKALLQTLVAEIRVKDRSWIQPIFRVPIFRPPSGLVPPVKFHLMRDVLAPPDVLRAVHQP